ncbi:MAG TPA: DUF2634 domain-containing protein, partial [Pseudoneobacillus sp.]|nr:DUF2634 domain-containing protein [Pseudoneobacillus sp.]
RFKHVCYSWDFGSEIFILIGSGYSRAAVESEVQRLVQESLQPNPYITGVKGFNINFDNESLTVDFILETIFGETEVSRLAY